MPRRTALFDRHVQAGAKIVDFAGWEMPISYTGIVAEHLAVRKQVGIFDVSHMGQFFVEGRDALSYLQNLCTNDIARCPLGKGIYSHVCNEAGGIMDDIFVYFVNPNQYLVIVNASTTEKDFNWFLKNKCGEVFISNQSDFWGMIALQGPSSENVLKPLFFDLPMRHGIGIRTYQKDSIWISRTGYTGEDGFEILVPHRLAPLLWDALLESGKRFGILPCGLGARDTLRLESGYLLYGQDMDESHTTLQSGPAWVLKWNKEKFIGKEALEQQKLRSPQIQLKGFLCLERGIPRHGSPIWCEDEKVGSVTSGTYSPSLQNGIAMGYIPIQCDGNFAIECSGKKVSAELVELPFIKN